MYDALFRFEKILLSVESFSLPVFESSSSFRHAGERAGVAPTVPNEFRRRAIASRAELPAADGTLVFEIRHSVTLWPGA